tara:strand:- start:913 stop:1776 length:864 start_codon:yes stop_codon:yes gene_type:complete
MEQKTKRAPGRSKAQQKPEVEAQTQVQETFTEQSVKTKTPVIRRQEDKSSTSVFAYEALVNKGPAYMLMSRAITIYSEEKNSLRAASYCPNENSIWKDEQSKDSKVMPIIFRDGYLTTNKNQPNLKAFLDVHPSNEANGGAGFRLIDTKVDTKKIVEKEFEVFDAISLIKNSDLNDLLAVGLYFNFDINRPVTEIKHDLLMLAKKNPANFIASFDDPVVKCKATIRQALDYQVIKSAKDSVRWYDSNGIIVSVPHGQSPVDIMSRYCLTDKGSVVLTEISNQLERLA